MSRPPLSHIPSLSGTPYCGAVDLPKKPATAFLGGAPAELVFQQNLNHFHEALPGSIDVAIS
jgi:hypothetical protein